MGLTNEPEVTQVNPNAPETQAVGGAASSFLQNLFAQPGQNIFGGQTSDLQRQATGAISNFLNQQAPEQQALGLIQPALQGLLGGGGGAAELENPFGDLGAFNQGQRVVEAAQPIFQQNLQTALTQSANRAPALRGTGFAGEAADISSRALQDFNLFQQQALQQGLSQQLQGQQSALDFMLGSRGLAQQGQQIGQQGILGAGGLLGQLAGQAGAAPFGRALQAGQLGAGITQQNINPTLQLLLGGLGFGQQAPMDAFVEPGGMTPFGSLLSGLATAGLGSFLGPIGAAGGSKLAGALFGGGNNNNVFD